MRVDAQRNHDHILEVARELFAGQGVKVQIDEIARAAGVGVGTVHRHFPTKEQLLEAVLVWSCEPLLDALEGALKGDDPGAGLESFLLRVVEYQSEQKALAEEMREMHDRSPELTDIKARISDLMAELVHRAQDAGQIRSDVGPGDLRLLLAGLAQTASASGAIFSPEDKVRFVRIMLDGLRTPAPTALPGDTPAL